MLIRRNVPCRINTKLVSSELEPMHDLVRDLSDGVKLIQLLVCGASTVNIDLVDSNDSPGTGNHVGDPLRTI